MRFRIRGEFFFSLLSFGGLILVSVLGGEEEEEHIKKRKATFPQPHQFKKKY